MNLNKARLFNMRQGEYGCVCVGVCAWELDMDTSPGALQPPCF